MRNDIIYVDRERGLRVREADLSKVEDLKILARAIKSDFLAGRETPTAVNDPFYSKFWSYYLELGWDMFCYHHNPTKTKFFIVLKDMRTVGFARVKEQKILGNKVFYPTIYANELEYPWSEITNDIRVCIFNMLRRFGFDRVFIELPFGHELNSKLPLRKMVVRFKELTEIWEMGS